MAKATVGEYRDAKATAHNLITTQIVDFTSGEAASSAFNSGTRSIRVVADAAAQFAIGVSAEAAATDQLLPANSQEYFAVEQGKGWSISLLANAL